MHIFVEPVTYTSAGGLSSEGETTIYVTVSAKTSHVRTKI